MIINRKKKMDENPNEKNRGKRRLIRIAGSLLSLAVLTYITIALISGRQSGLFRIFGLFSDNGSVEPASEYYFDVGRERVFADLDGSLAAAGTLGIQVLGAGGSETLRDSFRMDAPAIFVQDSHAISFDIGGKSVRVFDKAEIIASIETVGAIISASINRNGWFAICTQEGGTSRGVVTAYDNAGKVVYRVNLATGYVLSAVLSPDNKSLAILNLTSDGSRITFYSLNSEDVDRVFDLPGRLILDLRYRAGGDVLLIVEDALLIVDKNNDSSELYTFAGRNLGDFALDGDSIAIYLLDYNVGHSGRIVSIDGDRKILGEIETDREIIAISLCGGYLAILRNDGLAFYDTSLEELSLSEGTASAIGATRVLALGSDRVLAAGDHSAVAFTVEN